MRKVLSSFVAFAFVGALVACGGSDDSSDSSAESTTAPAQTSAPETTEAVVETDGASADGVLQVPQEFDTIQAAVDVAVAGDLVLIDAGVYNEAVQVTTDDIVIRGVDRNSVILDGRFELDNGFRVVAANGVAIENMTAQNFTKNGFFWTGSTGYRGSYLTAWRNGDYGIYAFDSVGGVLEHSYAAGSPDAGFYIGQCFPCDALIRNVVSEHNGLGYSGTNSGGNLVITDSIFRFNRAGIVPNSGSYELCYPQRATTITGNLVYSNNQPDTPAIDVAILAMGNGILSAGGTGNVIEKNRVYDHDRTGIGLVPFLEEDANDQIPSRDSWGESCEVSKTKDPVIPDGPLLWDSIDNVVRDNVTENNRRADIAVASAGTDLWTLGNCFSGNAHTSSAPLSLESLAPCDAAVSTDGDWVSGDLVVINWLVEAESAPPSVDYKTAPLPEQPTDLESMPDAETAPAVPASATPPSVDLAAVSIPDPVS